MKVKLHISESDSKKNLSFWNKLHKYVKQFNENSGIHGLRYLTEKKSNFEKLFWICVLLVSLTGCMFMIFEIVDRYEKNPVVVTFANRDTNIYEIPFPAVTICPEIISSGKLFSYSNVANKIGNNTSLTLSEQSKFEFLSVICYEDLSNLNIDLNKINMDTFYDTVYNLRNETQLMYGVYMSSLIDFETFPYFTNIITDSGICFTFNILDKSAIYKNHVFSYRNFHSIGAKTDYNADLGYSNDQDYPLRAISTPAERGFNLFLVDSTHPDDFSCIDFLQGYKVLLHDPRDFPQISKSFFNVPKNKAVSVAIKPAVTKISADVKNISPDKRNCYMQNERFLQHFQIYTQSNCMFECLTNYTLQKCGCVSFYMPRFDSTRICGAKDVECVVGAEISHKYEELENLKNGQNCDCKPSCTVLRYNIEASFNDFSWKDFQRNIGTQIDDDVQVAKVEIYFSDEQFTAIERKTLYGTSNLISNFGGLLGLFTGFSIISLVEIVYFCTIRVFYNIQLYSKWWGQTD